jgi:hypothetical protein
MGWSRSENWCSSPTPLLEQLYLTLVRSDTHGLKPLRELVQAIKTPVASAWAETAQRTGAENRAPKTKLDLTNVRTSQQKSPALAGLK